MRRSLLHAGRTYSSRTQHKLASGPFICSSCRSSLTSGRTQHIERASRSLSTANAFRQHTPVAEAQQPQRESVIPKTHFDLFPQTYPNGPPPNSPFTPDLRQLRREFLQIQAKTHPDLAQASQKRHAEALSARVNEAYKAIQDPLKRAQYLLSLRGIDVEDESAKLSENELLMEVMEAREAVDEVENEEELVSIRQTNDQRIQQSVAVLEEAFATGDLETAAHEAIRLRYWMNIEESIQGWEGGGMIHH